MFFSIEFDDFISPFEPECYIEKIYQTLKRVFNHISKLLTFHQKHSATRCILSSHGPCLEM